MCPVHLREEMMMSRLSFLPFVSNVMNLNRTLIGVTGGSGSGKTTLLRVIRETFTPDQVCIISQDEYYRDRSQQKLDAQGYYNFDVPHSLDLILFKEHVLSVLRGEDVKQKVYVFNNDPENARFVEYKAAPVVVIEGLFIFAAEEISDLVDYKVFVHATKDLRLIRRIHRDRAERNYSLENILHRYEHHVVPAYDRYIGRQRDVADIVINNEQSLEKGLDFLISLIKCKLE